MTEQYATKYDQAQGFDEKVNIVISISSHLTGLLERAATENDDTVRDQIVDAATIVSADIADMIESLPTSPDYAWGVEDDPYGFVEWVG